MTPARRWAEGLLVDTHIWVAAAAAGLTLFAATWLQVTNRMAPTAIVFSATLLIYAMDDAFDGRMRAQPARWLTLAAGVGALCASLYGAPSPVVVIVAVGSVPALLYGVPVCGRRRLRELPGVKPYFVTASLSLAAILVPSLWARVDGPSPHPAVARTIALTAALYALILSNVCFFDLRDRAADARAGLRTIPVRLGAAGTRRLCLGLSVVVAADAVLAGGQLRFPLLAAAVATAAYSRFLPAVSTRFGYALAVDGVPILLGLACLLA